MPPFLPGNCMNPEGRPKGTYNGRIRALATLDSFMSDPQVQNDLHAAFREAFQKNPMRFFRQIVMPLSPPKPNSPSMPKESSHGARS
jgi:hypothetical protein